MDCKESEQLMMAYIDSEIDASAVVRLRAHLCTCVACAAAHAGLANLRTTIREHATVYTAPAHLRHRVIAALSRKSILQCKFNSWPWAWITFGVATAFSGAFAAILLLHLAVPPASEQLEQELVASHFRSLMADHLTDISSTDQHTVKPWFAGKLDFSPPVFDLAPQGFPLIGGRHDYLDGRTVAALAYRRHQHVVNLFVWPNKSNERIAFHISSRQGYQLASWGTGGFHFVAVSDMNAHEFEELKRVFDAQTDKDG